MDFNADHFSLLDLPRCFTLDLSLLEARYRALQTQVHPDKFAHAGAAEQRLSLQWATRANEAYQILRNPISRAQYLLSLIEDEALVGSHLTLKSDFLIEQMEWREAVAEARLAGQINELHSLYQRVKRYMATLYAELAHYLDEQPKLEQANDIVYRLMFLDKLLAEINDALAQFDE